MNTTRKTSSAMPYKVRWQIERYRSISRLKTLLSIIILLMAIGFTDLRGQGVGISEVSISPDASAILELRHSSGPFKGLLIPRMTSAEMNGIAAPAEGLMIYNTVTNSFWYYYSGSWKSVPATFGLNSDAGVYTDNNGLLTSTPPISGTIGYWQRTGSVLSPANPGDDISTSGDLNVDGIVNLGSSGVATTIEGTMDVDEAANFDGDIDANNGIDVTAGDVDITDNLNVTGNADIDGTLDVEGQTDLAAAGTATNVRG
ncbi:MAG: polymer-forming cytoskeletal protein, partial [Eudoraea sp.]|nr:polymer-forming cytoskeletal protein [Eudoraea sp.]